MSANCCASCGTTREAHPADAGEAWCWHCLPKGDGGVRVSDEEFASWERDRKARGGRRRKPDNVDRELAQLRKHGPVHYLGRELVSATCPACRGWMSVEWVGPTVDFTCRRLGCGNWEIIDALGRTR